MHLHPLSGSRSWIAARRACDALHVVQSRAQVLVFEARCDEDRAQEYALGLWQAGLGSLEPVTELPKAGRNGVEAALRKAFSRYRSVLLDAYCLRGPAALATTQARKPASPRLMDQEPDPFEIEMEIERELESECWG